jgi:hypothetical protein
MLMGEIVRVRETIAHRWRSQKAKASRHAIRDTIYVSPDIPSQSAYLFVVVPFEEWCGKFCGVSGGIRIAFLWHRAYCL